MCGHLMIASHTGTKVIVDLRLDKSPSLVSSLALSRRNMIAHIAADCNQHVDALRTVAALDSQVGDVYSHLGANRRHHFVTTQRQPASDFILNYNGPLVTVLYMSFQDGNSEYFSSIVELLAARRHGIFAGEAFIFLDDVTMMKHPENSKRRSNCIWGNEALCLLITEGLCIVFEGSRWILKAP